MRTQLEALDELLGRRVSMRALALVRIPVGLIAASHLRPFLDAARGGRFYSDTFHEPYAPWYPELPRDLYVALLWAGTLAALAMAAGFWTRGSSAATFGVVTYNLFLSTTHFHNNRAYLVIILAVMAVAPCGRELSIDAWIRRTRGLPALDTRAPAWPLWLGRFEASVVYGASGLSKLLDPDWFGGTVTWDRTIHARDHLESATPLPGQVISVLTDRSFHTFAAKIIVLTELFIAIGLWPRRTRYAAVWTAVCFHIAIEMSASVQVFSYLAVAALAIWSVPSTRDRVLALDPTARHHQRLRHAVRWLDWLARFRIEAASPGTPVRLVDRDGTTRVGGPAAVYALSRMPLTASFALPALLLPRFRQRAGRAAGSTPTATPG